MIPIILEALAGLLEGGAVAGAAEGGAAAAAGTEGASALGGRMSGTIPSVLQHMGGNKFDSFAATRPVNIRESAHSTMNHITDMVTGDASKRPEASNDVEHIFGGRPDFLGSMSKKNPFVDMVSGNKSANDNFGEPGNDNVRDVVLASLEPILKSVDRNTAAIAMQTKEINDKIEKFFSDLGERDFEAKDKAANTSDIVTPSPAIPSENPSNDQDESEEEKKKRESSGVVSGLKKIGIGAIGIATGKVMNWLGGDSHRSKESGGYGNGDKDTTGGGGSGSGAERLHANPDANSDRSKSQLTLYHAFRDQGLSDEGAKTMVAQVGRENNFQKKYLFGTHTDAANGKTNAGIISWQGDRAKNLLKFLNDKGLVHGGKIDQNDEALKAQAEFLVKEMGKNNAKILKDLKDPSKKYEDLEAGVGDKVIAWRRNDSRYRSGGYKNQNRNFAEINALTNGSEGHWDKDFNPMAKIKGKHSDSMLMTNQKGKHDADSIDLSVPKGMTKDQYIKELKGMFPGAAVSSAQGNNVHIIFSGWGGASNIKTLDTSSAKGPKNGIGPAINNSSAKSAAKATAPQKPTVVHAPTPSPAPAAPVSKQTGTQKKLQVPDARPSKMDLWMNYFSY